MSCVTSMDFCLAEGHVVFIITEDHASIERIVQYRGEDQPVCCYPHHAMPAPALTHTRTRAHGPHIVQPPQMQRTRSKRSLNPRTLVTVPWGSGKRAARKSVPKAHDHGILEDLFKPSTRTRPKALSMDRLSQSHGSGDGVGSLNGSGNVPITGRSRRANTEESGDGHGASQPNGGAPTPGLGPTRVGSRTRLVVSDGGSEPGPGAGSLLATATPGEVAPTLGEGKPRQPRMLSEANGMGASFTMPRARGEGLVSRRVVVWCGVVCLRGFACRHLAPAHVRVAAVSTNSK